MGPQWIGLAAAAATFLGVWIGHVAVRKIEYMVEKLFFPIAAALVLGLGFEIGALAAPDTLTSAVLGILGMTLLWDSFEFRRQHKRVIKGYAPANPDNPRHARILADHPSATPIDLLDRDPVGRKVSHEQAIQLVKGQ